MIKTRLFFFPIMAHKVITLCHFNHLVLWHLQNTTNDWRGYSRNNVYSKPTSNDAMPSSVYAILTVSLLRSTILSGPRHVIVGRGLPHTWHVSRRLSPSRTYMSLSVSWNVGTDSNMMSGCIICVKKNWACHSGGRNWDYCTNFSKCHILCLI